MILLEADAVLRVEDGILATTMIHQDGAEVLLGLSGKGQIVVAHPEDDCHIQIVAHTDAKVQIEPWETAAGQPDFSMKLRVRLQQMEGWAAMQARPSLPQRVLGILGLLAGQFGCVQEQGTLIDVRVTHAQLASAAGATRTSITRVLGELRDAGKIMILSAQGEDRFCLCDKNLTEDHQCH
jgi:CRP-like cAMP-binding protein